MKRQKSLLYWILAAVLLAGGTLSSPGGKLCLSVVLTAREELAKLLVGKLNAKMSAIESKILGTGAGPCKRWAHLKDQSEKLGQASAELNGSLAMAQQTAGNIQIGEKTFQAQLDVLTSDRVLNSTRTSLEEAGEGIGKLAKHPDFVGQDDKLANCLRPIDPNTGVPKPSAWDKAPHLAKNGYTEAEYYKDWSDLLNDPRTQVGPKMWTEKMPDADTGAVAEVAVAARLKRQGHAGIQIGADEFPGALNGAKVDLLTDTEMYQVGLRGMTIKGKLDYPDELAKGIKQALDAQPGKRFKFAFTENDWTPLQSTIDELNTALSKLYPGGNAPQRFILSDFAFISLK